MKKSNLLTCVILLLSLSHSAVGASSKVDLNYEKNILSTIEQYTHASIFGEENVFKEVTSENFIIINTNGAADSRLFELGQLAPRKEAEFVRYESSSINIEKIELSSTKRLAMVYVTWRTKGINLEEESVFDGTSKYIFILGYNFPDLDSKTRRWIVLSRIAFP
ncbi:MAG: hypothetical protein OEZ43_21785 [Gammaproteobacteria bacterium]|nr:hypothetical protein [Gammaproteobacteria bacterium]